MFVICSVYVCDIDMANRIRSLAEEEEIEIRPPRRIYNRNHFIDIYNDKEFRRRFRLSKEAALHVLLDIEDDLEYSSERNNPVSPLNQLLLALRFYATGSYSLVLADYMGVSETTAHRTIHKVSKALANLRHKYIMFPSNDIEIREAMFNNYSVARFPKVIGMIDCTHIKIKSPGGNQAELYRNRKGYFSLNVQVIGNVDLLITDLVARWPGSAHDSTIFRSSSKRAMFEDGRYGNSVMLGDGGYPVLPYMMTPLPNPVSRAEQLYNESQIRTRNCVERLFGVWKKRFPVLALGFNVNLKNTFPIITATAVLHNILRMIGDPDPIDDATLVLPMPWEDLLQMGNIHQPYSSASTHSAGRRRRSEFVTEYFQRYFGFNIVFPVDGLPHKT